MRRSDRIISFVSFVSPESIAKLNWIYILHEISKMDYLAVGSDDVRMEWLQFFGKWLSESEIRTLKVNTENSLNLAGLL